MAAFLGFLVVFLSWICAWQLTGHEPAWMGSIKKKLGNGQQSPEQGLVMAASLGFLVVFLSWICAWHGPAFMGSIKKKLGIGQPSPEQVEAMMAKWRAKRNALQALEQKMDSRWSHDLAGVKKCIEHAKKLEVDSAVTDAAEAKFRKEMLNQLGNTYVMAKVIRTAFETTADDLEVLGAALKAMANIQRDYRTGVEKSDIKFVFKLLKDHSDNSELVANILDAAYGGVKFQGLSFLLEVEAQCQAIDAIKAAMEKWHQNLEVQRPAIMLLEALSRQPERYDLEVFAREYAFQNREILKQANLADLVSAAKNSWPDDQALQEDAARVLARAPECLGAS